jgi:outer membrane translocation and assembly module TamA
MVARHFVAAVPLLTALLPTAMGQLPKRVERCLPYPTLLQEIRELQQSDPEPRLTRVHVVEVEFDPPDSIPANIQAEIVRQLRSQVFERYASPTYLQELAQEIAEVGVTGALQNDGYFKSKAITKLIALENSGADTEAAATIHATPGMQYRTGVVRFESADNDVPLAISPEVLRQMIPLQTGALFSVERVRTGIENLTRAYQRKGYVDMLPQPNPVMDEIHERIDLVFRIDQGIQYRVGSIEFLGASKVLRERMTTSLAKLGEVFDGLRLEEFIRENRAILPPNASKDDLKMKRDVRAKTVALLFDFRTCPQESTYESHNSR